MMQTIKRRSWPQMDKPAHHLKRTLVYASKGGTDNTVIYLEGVELQFAVKVKACGSTGGHISTNSGCRLSKEELLYIANALPDDGNMFIAGCYHLDTKSLEEEFDELNRFEKTGFGEFSLMDK